MASPRRAPLSKVIDGMKFPIRFSEDSFRKAIQYRPQDDDIFLVTYPKCGTTWTQQILFLIFNHGKPPADFIEFNRSVPFLEMAGPEAVEKMRRPGAIKTHLPFHLAPYSTQAKYICVTRNPKDCCVSFYYQSKRHPSAAFTDGSFDDFFELFVTGDVEYGDYFDHLLGWHAHREDPNVLFLTYEGMKANAPAVVKSIAEFLGKEYSDDLERDPQLLKSILLFSSFDYMKTEVNKSISKLLSMSPEELDADPNVPKGFKQMVKSMQAGGGVTTDYIRKGIVGDWRNHFSTDQAQRMDERIAEKTAGSDVMDLWKDVDGL